MWYQGRWYQWFLFPFTVLFYLVSACRRLLFRTGVLSSEHINVPVVIVGNISVGGNGKTPLVLAIANYFHQRGRKVGIVSRGYGALTQDFPFLVTPNTPAKESGDEPLLMAQRSALPVIIDPNRARGATELSKRYGCDLIIGDDGLQHYKLQRDFEIVVTDRRFFGNGFLVPMGPLREGLWRLKTIDALVINQAQQSSAIPNELLDLSPTIMSFEIGKLTKVIDPSITKDITEFTHFSTISALAGIGDPQRFFDQLESAGLSIKASIALPDHHQLQTSDIPQGCVITTEKDAVKAKDLAHDDCWYLPINAQLPQSFYDQITQKLAL